MLLVLIAAVLFTGFAAVTSLMREDVGEGIFWALSLLVGFVLLGVAGLVACIGAGFLGAAKMARRWYEGDDKSGFNQV